MFSTPHLSPSQSPSGLGPSGYGSKLNHQGIAGFGPCTHLPGCHFGYPFLTHTHLLPGVPEPVRSVARSLPRPGAGLEDVSPEARDWAGFPTQTKKETIRFASITGICRKQVCRKGFPSSFLVDPKSHWKPFAGRSGWAVDHCHSHAFGSTPLRLVSQKGKILFQFSWLLLWPSDGQPQGKLSAAKRFPFTSLACARILGAALVLEVGTPFYCVRPRGAPICSFQSC